MTTNIIFEAYLRDVRRMLVDAKRAPFVGISLGVMMLTRLPSLSPLSRFPVRLIRVLGLMGLGVAVPGGSAAQDVDLDGVGYVLGSSEAPVTVVELGDFGCWACALFHETTWPAIEREFVQTGRVQWRHVPFLFGLGHGDDGTKAAECVADQGQYWEMHDLLYTRHEEWTKPRNPKDFLHAYANELGLEAEAFETCYKDNHGKDRTRRATRAADELDVSGTPTFFINGSRALGALTIEVFRGLIEEAERAATPGA